MYLTIKSTRLKILIMNFQLTFIDIIIYIQFELNTYILKSNPIEKCQIVS